MRLSAVLTGGFWLTGMATVLAGPLIPEMLSPWGVSSAAAASLFAIQFTASSLGAVLSSFHLRRSLLVGYGALAAGLALLAAGSWSLARPAMALLGLGLGLSIPATNLRVARAHPGRRGAALNTLNLAWGLGAVSCPLLFALLRGRLPPSAAPAILAAMTAIFFLLLLAVLGRGEKGDETDHATPAPGTESPAPGWSSLLLIACILFLYIGIENAIGGWLPTLADHLAGERDAVSMLIGAGFWAALLAGRGIAPWLLVRLSEAALFRAGLLLAWLGNLGLLLADDRAVVAVASILAGAGLAPLFPLTVALLAERTAANGSRGTGWVFAVGGMGGAVLPWLTGLWGGAAGVGSGAFVLPLAGLTMMLAAWWLASRSPVRERRFEI